MSNAKEVKRIVVADYGFMAVERISAVYGSGSNEKTYVSYVLGTKKLTPTGYELESKVRIPEEMFSDGYLKIFDDAVAKSKSFRADYIKKALAEKKKLVEPLEIQLKAAKDVMAIYQKTAGMDKEVEKQQKVIDGLNAQINKVLNF